MVRGKTLIKFLIIGGQKWEAVFTRGRGRLRPAPVRLSLRASSQLLQKTVQPDSATSLRGAASPS